MLGFIPVPYGQIPGSYPSEIGYTVGGGTGPFLCPPDPQWNTRGEPGMYYDTPLGGLGAAAEYNLVGAVVAALRTLSPSQRARLVRRMQNARRTSGMRGIPTDFELATVYQYTPFASGWVAAKEGDYTSNWVPPNGWDPAGAYGPPVAPAPGAMGGPNLQAADVTIPASATPSETQALVDTLNAQSNRSFKLAIVTTVVIGTAAIINSIRTWKQLRRDEELLKRKL